MSGQFPLEGCKIHHVDQVFLTRMNVLVIVVPSPKRLRLPVSLSFQGHGSHRHLLRGTSEQDPDQRAGNAVPNATDARQNGSRLRDFNK